MDIVLANFINDDDAALERRIAAGRASLHLHRADPARPGLPDALCRIADALILFSANEPIGRPPADFPRCRVLVREGVGYDTIDLRAWGEAGVPVCNVPDYGTSEVADHAIALMLALLRGTATYHDALRTDPVGGWRFAAAPAVRRVRGLTFGVVGMGRIGTAAAARARGFGMEIAFFDPGLSSGMEIALAARRAASLEELLATCDVVSLHAPASEETRAMIGRAALRAARPGLALVNTARGSLVDLDALHDAMHEGVVVAAGLDVLPSEPLDASQPLFRAWLAREPWLEGRLTLSPHAAFYSPEALVDLRTNGLETALGVLERGEVRNCVNAEFLKRPSR